MTFIIKCFLLSSLSYYYHTVIILFLSNNDPKRVGERVNLKKTLPFQETKNLVIKI